MIVAAILDARARNRAVNQVALQLLLPHLTKQALSSRVHRLKAKLDNQRQRRRPQQPRQPVAPATAAPPQATMIPVAPTAPPQSLTVAATSATADRAVDEVQVAMQLATFGASSSVSSANIDPPQRVDQAQEEDVHVRGQVQAPHMDVASREEIVRMQNEDIESSRMERLELVSTFSATERFVQTVQSQLQVSQAEIASRDETIQKLHQDLEAIRSDHDTELHKLNQDIASKDETIKKLNQDIRGRESSQEILLQRRLDAALQEITSKDKEIDKLKSDPRVRLMVDSNWHRSTSRPK